MIDSAEILDYQPGTKVITSKSANVVLVGGCFDVLHYGHIHFLQSAKQQGTFLVVALEPDITIHGGKRKKLFHPQTQRGQNLAALRCVDLVLNLPVLKSFEDYRQLTEDICPQIIAITQGDPQTESKQLHAKAVSAELKIVTELLNDLSSTKVKENGWAEH